MLEINKLKNIKGVSVSSLITLGVPSDYSI